MANSITYDATVQKYRVTVADKTIETTVTVTASVIDEWIRDVMLVSSTPTVVGLDIEWRPHEINFMSNKTATLQLCTDSKCLIVQLFYVDYIPQSLKDFMESTDYVFVGVEVADDAAKLKTEYGLRCGKTADVKAAAMRRWPNRFRRPGLKDLALELVGLRMEKDKRVTCSDWQARVLSEVQIKYACIDAYASYKLGSQLL